MHDINELYKQWDELNSPMDKNEFEDLYKKAKDCSRNLNIIKVHKMLDGSIRFSTDYHPFYFSYKQGGLYNLLQSMVFKIRESRYYRNSMSEESQSELLVLAKAIFSEYAYRYLKMLSNAERTYVTVKTSDGRCDAVPSTSGLTSDQISEAVEIIKASNDTDEFKEEMFNFILKIDCPVEKERIDTCVNVFKNGETVADVLADILYLYDIYSPNLYITSREHGEKPNILRNMITTD